MNTKSIFAKLIFLVSITIFTTTAWAKEDPGQYLEKVATALTDKITANKEALKTDNKLAEKLVREQLLPAIDKEGFAKRTLGKNAWSKASDEQKSQFIGSFIQLVINNYAKGLSLYDGQAFKFSKALLSKSGKSAKVRSSMDQANSTPIIIDYVLSNKTGSWKIINLTVEGVDMAKSYKNQFLPRLKTLGMDAFLKELKTKETEAVSKI